MTCNEPIEPLEGSGDGSIDKLTCTQSVQLTLLTCCDTPAPPQQELVRRWKQVRRDTFSTVPFQFGKESFSTGFGFGPIGPPTPGKATGPILGHGGPIDPPPVDRPPPENTPISELPD